MGSVVYNKRTLGFCLSLYESWKGFFPAQFRAFRWGRLRVAFLFNGRTSRVCIALHPVRSIG